MFRIGPVVQRNAVGKTLNKERPLSYFKTPVFVLLASLGLILEAPLPAVAQRLSLGIKAGVATLEPVSAVGIFGTQLHPLVFGPVIEVGLPHDLRVEVSALHRHITYRWKAPIFASALFPPQQVQEETRAGSWELPVVLRKPVSFGRRFRPFGEVGLAIRHTSSTTHAHGYVYEQVTAPAPFSVDEKTTELVKPWSRGLVVGVGQELKIGLLYVQPQLRYMRFSTTFVGHGVPPPRIGLAGLQSNPNSLDLLIRVTFTPRPKYH
jgi:hypothetical protein